MLTGWANEIGEGDPRRAVVRGVLGKPLDLDRLRAVLGMPPSPPGGDRTRREEEREPAGAASH